MKENQKKQRTKSNKTENKSKSESSVKSKDINYINQKDNVETLRKKLSNEKLDNSKEIKELDVFYDRYDSLKNVLEEPNFKNYKLEDDIFEKKINQILEKNLGLNAFDYFPLFKIYTSRQKGKEVTSLNYYKITISEEDNIYDISPTEFNFFPHGNYQFLQYKDYSFLIEFKDNNPNKLYINLTEQYVKKRLEKNFIAEEQNIYNCSFYINEISPKFEILF